MKKQRIIELAVKVLVAALTAFLTAIGTTSCMGHGPIAFWTVTCQSLRVRNLPQEVADFVFVHKLRHFATLPLCHIKDYSIGELQGYYLTVSIPVTMLLLEKNGWWRDKSNANAFIHPHLGSDNKIVFKDNVPVFHNVQIPYVHQLQNVLHEHNENISIHMQIFKI